MAIIKPNGKNLLRYRILILCFVFTIFAGVSQAKVTHEREIEKSISSDGVTLVKVETVSGNIKVNSWERPKVFVKAFKRVRADNDEKAREYSDKIEVRIEKVGDRIEIQTKQSLLSSLLKQMEASVSYEVMIPEHMNLELKSIDGSINVMGNRGSERITTVDGNIDIRDMIGSVSAKTIDGNISAVVRLDSESSFFTTDGSIDIYIEDEFSVPISARTISGSINVVIPEGYSADLDASVLSGQVVSYIPIDGSVEDRSIKGGIFGGGPKLKLRSTDGTISIRTREIDEAAAPPLPPPSRERPMTGIPREPRKPKPVKKLEVPYAEAVKTLSSPIIDGRLDDDCWKDAGKIGNFVWADGVEKPYEPTEAYLLWDEHNFYIGIKCYESSMEAIKISVTEADKEIWEDDNVQLFIDTTPNDEAWYYHIAVNPVGAVFDEEIERIGHPKHHRPERSQRGIKWNAGGLFETDIRSNLWSIEAGIPFSALKAQPKEGDVWRFNIYRMEQRREEHTYWSPTYAKPDMPHVPMRFGELGFVTVKLVTEPSKEPEPTPKEALAIADIIIQGNYKVSNEEILEALNLKPGDLADVESLSKAKANLDSLGLFINVSMDLTDNDKGVDLVVKVVEKEIITPSEIQIRGATAFEEEQIKDLFNLKPFRTTMEDVATKSSLIQELYKSKGYEMAEVEYSFIPNTLIIDVDEGTIDIIEVRGNDKVRTKDIMKNLDLEIGMPYKRDRIENATYTLKARLPYFRSVTWESGRSEDGLRIVYIDVKEADLIKAKLDPTGEFNRVHGLQLGLRSELNSTYGMAKAYWEMRYGFSSEIWDYRFGVEKSWFRGHKSTIGIDVHRLTDTNDWELVSDFEHFIAEAILGEAWRDFYQREGYEIKFAQEINPGNEFSLKYRDDDYISLEKHNDWSLLNRSYEDDDWTDDFRWTGGRETSSRGRYRLDEDDNYKPENPPIMEGEIRSVIAEYTVDTRNSEKDPSSGWFNVLSVEYAGRGAGGDSDFTLYKANIRRYNRLSGNQFFSFRVKAATADRQLPELHPRKFYLGGIGTLRGYRFKEYSGDKMVLINAEYWIMTRWPSGLGIVFFVDSGYAWPYDWEMKADDMKTDLGIGFQLGGLRVNLASPIRERDKETIFSARLARMF
jgi:outer membrane protein insertion porin family